MTSLAPADLILATANARFSHTSLALRSLVANLGRLRDRAALMEFTIDDTAEDIAEQILSMSPKVVALSVYLWNVTILTQVAAIIKGVHGDVRIVLGGPEVSFGADELEITRYADHVIAGEGERVFPALVSQILERGMPPPKYLTGEPVDLKETELPTELYTDSDIANRVVYVETSRGCPFGCEFCLSGLDKKVRRYPEDRVLAALASLWDRGVRKFKFIDRSLHLLGSPVVLDFFRERRDEPLFVHFELVPDRLPDWARERLGYFPGGAIQLEAGLQTLNEAVARRIGRRQDTARALANLEMLRQETGVHLHADLVVGLPGEDLASFRAGFDRLFALGLQEIQVGILKRLRGAAISRHDEPWEMAYNPAPPYDILQNKLIDFSAMQRLKRFAKYVELICNRGNFTLFLPLLHEGASPFDSLMALSEWLYEKTGRTHAIALNRMAEHLFEYVTTRRRVPPAEAANRLAADFSRTGRRRFPSVVARYVTELPERTVPETTKSLPPRQRRHRR